MNKPKEAPSATPTIGATVLRLVPRIRRQADQQTSAAPSTECLERQVNSLRLSKMLDMLGVPKEGYYSLMSEEIIQRHISNCRHCTRSPSVRICDAYLDEGRPVRNMRFCPNYLSLIANSPAFYEQRTRRHGARR
ncbi:MAG TPA: hypothetical protein ENJ22_01450 [Gammaproteobacteria bacterium]|nr:hypothetical protein [Gammaproteobacteria bacterium]